MLKKLLMTFMILFLILVSACVPVGTPTPTDIPEQNPHEQLPDFTTINNNPFFTGSPLVFNIAGRHVASPQGWFFVYHLGSLQLPPFVFNKAEGYQFEISYIDGSFGFRQDLHLYSGVRYLLKSVYTTDFEGSPTDLTTSIVVGGYDFPVQNPTVTKGENQNVWVFEVQESGVYPVAFEYYIEWAVINGNTILNSIEVQKVNDSYGKFIVQTIGENNE